jgi:hypothetical protein
LIFFGRLAHWTLPFGLDRAARGGLAPSPLWNGSNTSQAIMKIYIF